jgi:hypothetical protein
VRVTRAHFKTYAEHVRLWCLRFGLVEYALAFEHHQLADGRLAEVEYDPEGKTAVFRLTKTAVELDPEACAKHEAAHLLLGKLVWLAEARFINQKQIEDEAERIVMVLEKILE